MYVKYANIDGFCRDHRSYGSLWAYPSKILKFALLHESCKAHSGWLTTLSIFLGPVPRYLAPIPCTCNVVLFTAVQFPVYCGGYIIPQQNNA